MQVCVILKRLPRSPGHRGGYLKFWSRGGGGDAILTQTYPEDGATGALQLREHSPRKSKAEDRHRHHEVAHVAV